MENWREGRHRHVLAENGRVLERAPFMINKGKTNGQASGYSLRPW